MSCALRGRRPRRASLGRSATGRPRRRSTVLDCGGGTGRMAVPLAQLGAEVTVVDISVDALATLSRRAAEAGVGRSGHPVQGDIEALAESIGDGDLRPGARARRARRRRSAAGARRRPRARCARAGWPACVVANPAAGVLAKVLAGELEARGRARRCDDAASRASTPTTVAPAVPRRRASTSSRSSGVGVFTELIPLGAPAASPPAATRWPSWRPSSRSSAASCRRFARSRPGCTCSPRRAAEPARRDGAQRRRSADARAAPAATTPAATSCTSTWTRSSPASRSGADPSCAAGPVLVGGGDPRSGRRRVLRGAPLRRAQRDADDAGRCGCARTRSCCRPIGPPTRPRRPR